jgi:hypothetical protein
LRERYSNACLVVMSPAGAWLRSGHPAKWCRGCKLLSGAGVRPAWRDGLWRRAEDLSLTPFGAIGVRSRAGAPVRLTLQDWDDASSNRHPNLSFCLSMISAQTLRVCREGKPVPTFPDHAPRWRTAEALIPSAEAPTRFPIEAGGAPVHCPNGGVTAGLHRNASRRPSVFKAAPARSSGSSSRQQIWSPR